MRRSPVPKALSRLRQVCTQLIAQGEDLFRSAFRSVGPRVDIRAPVFWRCAWIASSDEDVQVGNSFSEKNNIAAFGTNTCLERLAKPRYLQANCLSFAIGEICEGRRVPPGLHHEIAQVHRHRIVKVVTGVDEFIFIDGSANDGDQPALDLTKQAFQHMFPSFLMKRQPFALMTIASLLRPSHPPVSYRWNDEILTTIFESTSLSCIFPENCTGSSRNFLGIVRKNVSPSIRVNRMGVTISKWEEQTVSSLSASEPIRSSIFLVENK